ncbi:MAG: VWA domain-containing protein [Bacteroidota bacterium]
MTPSGTPRFGALGLGDLREAWEAAWEPALACWSPFTRLRRPTWCLTEADEKREGLTGSFAMIRLDDHAVVISLRQVAEQGLGAFAREILAHEIGHHILAPGTLDRHARSLAHVRAGLPSVEHTAPYVANLYTDLLINDRLQRQNELDLLGVWRALDSGAGAALWTLYLRIYEVLWGLQSGTLARGERTPRLDADASLAARLVRVYGRDWLDGAGRFATLCLPYLLDDAAAAEALAAWHDTAHAGRGDFPAGLTEIGASERDGAIHPAFDPRISGIDPADAEAIQAGDGLSGASDALGGQKSEKTHRGPVEYGELLRMAGLAVSESEAAVRYYRERAVPHLVPFPSRLGAEATDPLPEGLEPWTVGDPLQAADWVESVFRSPRVIPGFTTVQRSYGPEAGGTPERTPVDLYVGIDCSGSMPNPRRQVSYPAIAGAVVSLSALRAGAAVDVVLSGEPGRSVGLGGPSRDEGRVLALLTDYLGTGFAYGVHRLGDTFAAPLDRPTHILLISDSDLFLMLDATEAGLAKSYGHWAEGGGPLGWEVAEAALAAAGGGGTIVLELPPDAHPEAVARLRAQGWDVHFVRDQAELIGFARAFARAVYAAERAER